MKISIVIFISLVMIGCGRLESVLNPGGIITTDSTKTGNPIISMATERYQGFVVLSICMAALELRKTYSGGNMNLGITPKWVSVTPLGSSLGSVAVPPNDYDLFELHASGICGKSYGIEVINSFGMFQTSVPVEMVFEGRMIVEKGNITPPFVLNFENLIVQLMKVKSNSELRDVFLLNRGTISLSYVTPET